MTEQFDLENPCPFLGTQADRDTHYGFPIPENRCHKPQSDQRISLSYQSNVCLTGKHLECPAFKHQGTWSGPLPPEVQSETGDSAAAAQRWQNNWLERSTVGRLADVLESEKGEAERLPEAVSPVSALNPGLARKALPQSTQGTDLPEQGFVKVIGTPEKDWAKPADSAPARKSAVNKAPASAKTQSKSRLRLPLILGLIFVGTLFIGGAILGGVLLLTSRETVQPAVPISDSTPVPTATLIPTVLPPTLTPTLLPTEASQPETVEATAIPTDVPPDPTETPASEQGFVPVTVIFDSNMRSGPGTDYAVLEQLPEGTNAAAIGRDNPALWYLVRLEDGREGWIAATQFAEEIDITLVPIITNIPPPPNG